MTLDALVDSLLYEGYALYPYTPGSAKNATPTPFGIVYPPRYAQECAGAFDHARLECEVLGGSSLRATIRWLEPSGDRHRADARELQLGPIPPAGGRVSEQRGNARFTLRSDADGVVRCCVHNTAEVGAALDRATALHDALISVHIVVRVDGGRFVSPLDSERRSVNTWPVLATPNDDTILGAAIVLPDHPQLSPHSRLDLFDNTEIEEALVLHVQALSDAERDQIDDPAVKDMLQRAMAVGPDQLGQLHGVLQEADNNPGEESATIEGVTFRKGCKLLLAPGTERDVFDGLLHGRRATLERIYVDYDDRVHLGVTVDDDPGQALMRETGRYLFFFAHEVQPL